MNRCDWLLSRGAAQVYTIAIDMNELRGIKLLDAYAIAGRLEYIDTHANPRMRLYNQIGEYILYGGKPGDVYAVLAVIPGTGEGVSVPVHLGRLRVPQGLLLAIGSEESEAVIRDMAEQIYTHTDVFDVWKLIRLLQAMCIERFDKLTLCALCLLQVFEQGHLDKVSF